MSNEESDDINLDEIVERLRKNDFIKEKEKNVLVKYSALRAKENEELYEALLDNEWDDPFVNINMDEVKDKFVKVKTRIWEDTVQIDDDEDDDELDLEDDEEGDDWDMNLDVPQLGKPKSLEKPKSQ